MDHLLSLGDRRILQHVDCARAAQQTPSVRLCGNFYWSHHLLVFLGVHLVISVFNKHYFHQYRALRHYAAVWAAIMTSPRGVQLDFWLVVMCAMDLVPLAFGLVHSWWLGLFRNGSQSEEGMWSKVLLNVAYTMQDFSPAYQFNQLVLGLVDGSFVDHTYVIMFLTVFITESHRFLVKQLYCKTLTL